MASEERHGPEGQHLHEEVVVLSVTGAIISAHVVAERSFGLPGPA